MNNKINNKQKNLLHQPINRHNIDKVFSESKQSPKAFLKRQDVQEFITRPFSQVEWQDDAPVLSNFEKKHVKAYYRNPPIKAFLLRDISTITYKILRLLNLRKVNYFLDKGINSKRQALLNNSLHEKFIKNNKTPNTIIVKNPITIEDIPELLTSIKNTGEYKEDGKHTVTKHFLEKKPYSLNKQHSHTFVIFSFIQPRHTYPMLAVINNETQETESLIMLETTDHPVINIQEKLEFTNTYKEYELPIPSLFNCNIDVQKHDHDFNCGLYSYRMKKALLKLISSHNSFAEKLIKLKNNPSELEDISFIFRSKLPEFYTRKKRKFTPKSWKELKPFFLKRRWNTDRKSIRHKLNKSRILPKSLKTLLLYMGFLTCLLLLPIFLVLFSFLLLLLFLLALSLYTYLTSCLAYTAFV